MGAGWGAPHPCKHSDTQHVHACTSTRAHSPYTHTQHSRAARTPMHKPSDMQPVHACTSPQTRSPYPRAQHSDTQPVHACTALRHSTYTRAHTHPSSHVHTHTSSDIHVLVHTQQLPTGGVGLSRSGGRCVPTHLVILGWVHGGVAPLKRGLGLLQQGAPVLGVVGCGGFSPLSATAALARPCIPLPRHPGWSRHCPSVDQNRPPPFRAGAPCLSPAPQTWQAASGCEGVQSRPPPTD